MTEIKKMMTVERSYLKGALTKEAKAGLSSLFFSVSDLSFTSIHRTYTFNVSGI